MNLNASISKTIIILTLFFFVFNIPSSMAELERSYKVTKIGAEVKDDGIHPSYGSLHPNKPAVPSHPGQPYTRTCRSLYFCRSPPHHLASP